MLKKVLKVNGVGKLVSYSARGQVDLKRFNFVFGPNGSGKSTLVSILRSFQSAENELILERQTLGLADVPTVELLHVANGNCKFDGTSWSNNDPDMWIFDQSFVARNVFNGDGIGADQRKNLFDFAIGEEETRLANREVVLEGLIEEQNNLLKDREKRLQRLTKGNIDVATFVSLPHESEIDERIRHKQSEIERLRKGDLLSRQEELETIELPALPDVELRNLLSRTIDDISAEAEQKVRQHLDRCMDASGPAWIKQGLGYVVEDRCPFCDQELAPAADLLDAYRACFTQAYDDLGKEIDDLRTRIDAELAEHVIEQMITVVARNQIRLRIWQPYLDIDAWPYLPERPKDRVAAAREALRKALLTKSVMILDESPLPEEFGPAVIWYALLRIEVENYNRNLREINQQIRDVKGGLSASTLEQAEKELLRLENQRQRYDEDTACLCEEWIETISQRDHFQSEKDEVREKLKDQVPSLLKQYAARINQLLTSFGAEFTIEHRGQTHLRGGGRVDYGFRIRDVSIDIESKERVPTFKTTLSNGDRTTLALALFIARVERDADLSDKIVIFDDPMSSMDRRRRHSTVEHICRIAGNAKQLMLLSHDEFFLRDVWEMIYSNPANNGEISSLSIVDTGAGSSIGYWDIDEETRGPQYERYRKLVGFLDNPPRYDPSGVLIDMRRFIEDALCHRCPGSLKASESLGIMVEKVRSDTSNAELQKLDAHLEELDSLNKYIRIYSHGSGQNPSSGSVNPDELKGYVQRALAL